MSDVAGMDSGSTTTTFTKTHHWHEWKIEKFSTAVKHGELVSSTFTVKTHNAYRFCLHLTHNISLESKTPGYFLRLHVINPSEVLLIKLTLGIIHVEKSFLHSYEEGEILGKLKGCDFITSSDFEDGKEKYLNGDTLTIGCKITLFKQVKSSSADYEQDIPVPISQLLHDVGQLFNDAKTSDITFTVGTQEFHAHRAILMARSSVFAAMLENQMQESIKKTINIDDLDAEVVEQVLRFIYTDKSDLKNKTSQLLYAAEKYDLQKLKARARRLFKDISAEIAADVLMVADRYQAHRLKTKVCRFIALDIKEVLVTKGYKEMEKNHPELILQVVRAMK